MLAGGLGLAGPEVLVPANETDMYHFASQKLENAFFVCNRE